MVAKRRPAMVHFTEVFTHGDAKKQYLTLAKGTSPAAEGRIDLPLSEHQQSAESKARRGVNMQEAVTRYRVLRQGEEAALLEVTLETGRTHQIRSHLAAIGHPVAGDRKYGDFAFNRDARARWGLKRLFLHAERIELPHPETGARIRRGVAASAGAGGRASPRRHPSGRRRTPGPLTPGMEAQGVTRTFPPPCSAARNASRT